MITKNIGIIGYGSMGSILLNGIVQSDVIENTKLFIATRTQEKVVGLKMYGVTVCSTNCELVQRCDLIFICVKPLDVHDVLVTVKDRLTEEKHVVSIAGSLKIGMIEKIYAGKISRVMPTFISTVHEGITLVCHNSAVTEQDKQGLEMVLKCFSTIKEIPESEFELVSELTSCAPGFIAAIFEEYLSAASKHSQIETDDLRKMIIKTLLGTARLLDEFNADFDETIKRVATKGGTTEVGVEVLKRKLPDVFDEMFTRTLERQHSRMIAIDEQYK